MSIATQLGQLADSKNDIKEVLIEKGVDVENFNFNNLSTLMENMSGGGSTTDTDLEIPASYCRYLFTLAQVDTDVVINLYIKPDVVYKSYKFKPSSIGITSSDDIDWTYTGQKAISIYDNVIVFVVPISDATLIIVSTDDGKTWRLIRKDSSGNKLTAHQFDGDISIRMNAYSFGVIVRSYYTDPQNTYYYSDNFLSVSKVSESEYNDYFSNDITPIEKTLGLKRTGIQDTAVIENFKIATNLTSNEYVVINHYEKCYIASTAASKNMYGPTSCDVYISKDLNNWYKINNDTKLTYGIDIYAIKTGIVLYVPYNLSGSPNYFVHVDKNDFSNQKVIYETGKGESWTLNSFGGEYIIATVYTSGSKKGISIDNNGIIASIPTNSNYPSATMTVYTGKKNISKNDAIKALI